MEIQANPAAEHLQIYIWILVPVVGALLALIIYFINKIVDKVVAAFNGMIESLDDLKNTFGSFKEEFASLKTKVDLESPGVARRLNSHSRSLKNHEKRISNIELSHNMIHKNCKLPNETNEEFPSGQD
jgi:hypothetical protein